MKEFNKYFLSLLAGIVVSTSFLWVGFDFFYDVKRNFGEADKGGVASTQAYILEYSSHLTSKEVSSLIVAQNQEMQPLKQCSKIFRDINCIEIKIFDDDLTKIGYEKMQEIVSNPCSMYKSPQVISSISDRANRTITKKELSKAFSKCTSNILSNYHILLRSYNKNSKLMSQYYFNSKI